MPIFDYECSCGKTKEELVGLSDEKVKCECGKKMKKLITGFARINDRFEMKQKIKGGDMQLPG